MKSHLRPCLVLFTVLTVLTGVLYPLAVTAVAALCFPHQAGGSLVRNQDGTVIGSELLAQKFTGAGYFHPRPSACDYATIPSGASNLGPTSKALQEAMAGRTKALRQENHLAESAPLPADLLQASGSGLDPDISPESARLQLPRVAAARGLNTTTGLARLEALVQAVTQPPQFGVLGQERVNVLQLNLALVAADASASTIKTTTQENGRIST